jgi:hypothetical protein
MQTMMKTVIALGFAGAMVFGSATPSSAQGFYVEGPGFGFGIGRPYSPYYGNYWSGYRAYGPYHGPYAYAPAETFAYVEPAYPRWRGPSFIGPRSYNWQWREWHDPQYQAD